MKTISPITAQDKSHQDIFDGAWTYLIESLKESNFLDSSLNSKNINPGPRILKLLIEHKYRDAYDLLYLLVKKNNTSDILFLGLAFTNLYLNYPKAAAKYAMQASKLHNIINKGLQSELLSSFAKILIRQVEDSINSKIIVNNRFINIFPTKDQLEQTNAVDTYLMEGLKPSKPFISKSDRITTLGSCFTGDVSKFLRHNGFDVPMLNSNDSGNFATGSFSAEVFNTYILRYLFELAFGDAVVNDDEYEVVDNHNLKISYSINHLKETILSSKIFIITLGISEVWFNKNTGEVYKTAKSVGEYDENVHDFRVTSVQENLKNIEYVYESIRRNIKDAAIIFTLSPVPFKATFRKMGAIPANTISKAILRVSLDQLLNNHESDNNLYYFPSYELVKECLPNPFNQSRRHVSPKAVDFIMTLFANHYVVLET